jgi:DNA replication factor GINS
MANDLHVAITYETLFDLLRREKGREGIQKLPDNFYQDVVAYIAEKKNIGDEQRDTQLVNIRRILRELYDRREKKILAMAVDKARTGSAIVSLSGLLPEERRLFDDISKELIQHRKEIIEKLQEGVLPTHEHEEKGEKSSLVRFKEAVPKFVGKNLETYGPFNPEDMATLPKDIVDILVDKQKAEIIEGD